MVKVRAGDQKKDDPVQGAKENFRRVEREPQKYTFRKQWLRPLIANW